MSDVGLIPATGFRPRGIGLLLRLKARALANHFLQTLRQAPAKIVSAVAAIALIWVGLEQLFELIFEMVRNDTYEGIVAIPLMLDFFFVALMFMLVFSNAIISYGSLFAKGEPAYLLTRPLRSSSVVLLKYLESLFFSSWSLLLIGIPLMLALARMTAGAPWYYYPLFGVFFLCFIPIPGAIGLLVAWAVGQWFSRIARRMLFLSLSITLALLSVGLWRFWGPVHADSKIWLNQFFDRAAFIQGTFWPSRWVSSGLNHARDAQIPGAMFYLFLTFSNALFLSWVAIRVTGGRLLTAYDRVQGCEHKHRYDGRVTRGFASVLFWYLPDHLREIALKDLRSFLRDPTQWSQLLILLALLGLYVINIPNVRLPLNMDEFGFQLLISFLTTTIIALFLATFTSRFVFPLVSLEAQRLWLIGLLPIPRGRVLIPKFVFSLTVTVAAGGSVMFLATLLSRTGGELLAINMLSIIAVCVGLCGMAVGLGARMPMVHEANPAKIANGLGGTINLVASIAMVTVMLAVILFLGLRFRSLEAVVMDGTTIGLLATLAAVSTLSCVVPMRLGQRYFTRLEF